MFSVVIPTFKNYSVLNDAIKSCDNSLIKEVIIIDDTTSIEQKKISCEPFFNEINLKVIINNKNRGVTFSRNRGYLLSNQPFVIFLDSDDTLVKDNLLEASQYLINEKVDCGFFNTITNNIKNSQLVTSLQGDWRLIFQMANSGERLVIVRNNKTKPFYGFLRGHELAGLFRFAEKNSFRLGWSPIVLREYNQSNDNSLSQMRLSKERSYLISIGHQKVAKKLLSLSEFKLSALYFIKACYYAISSRISR